MSEKPPRKGRVSKRERKFGTNKRNRNQEEFPKEIPIPKSASASTQKLTESVPKTEIDSTHEAQDQEKSPATLQESHTELERKDEVRQKISHNIAEIRRRLQDQFDEKEINRETFEKGLEIINFREETLREQNDKGDLDIEDVPERIFFSSELKVPDPTGEAEDALANQETKQLKTSVSLEEQMERMRANMFLSKDATYDQALELGAKKLRFEFESDSAPEYDAIERSTTKQERTYGPTEKHVDPESAVKAAENIDGLLQQHKSELNTRLLVGEFEKLKERDRLALESLAQEIQTERVTVEELFLDGEINEQERDSALDVLLQKEQDIQDPAISFVDKIKPIEIEWEERQLADVIAGSAKRARRSIEEQIGAGDLLPEEQQNQLDRIALVEYKLVNTNVTADQVAEIFHRTVREHAEEPGDIISEVITMEHEKRTFDAARLAESVQSSEETVEKVFTALENKHERAQVAEQERKMVELHGQEFVDEQKARAEAEQVAAQERAEKIRERVAATNNDLEQEHQQLEQEMERQLNRHMNLRVEEKGIPHQHMAEDIARVEQEYKELSSQEVTITKLTEWVDFLKNQEEGRFLTPAQTKVREAFESLLKNKKELEMDDSWFAGMGNNLLVLNAEADVAHALAVNNMKNKPWPINKGGIGGTLSYGMRTAGRAIGQNAAIGGMNVFKSLRYGVLGAGIFLAFGCSWLADKGLGWLSSKFKTMAKTGKM